MRFIHGSIVFSLIAAGAACQSTPKKPANPTQTALEGGGNNSGTGTMSGTPATGGTDPRGTGDDGATAPTQTPTPAPSPLPKPEPPQPTPEPPPNDAGTNSGGTSLPPPR